MTRGQDCQGGLYTEPQLRTMQEWWIASLGLDPLLVFNLSNIR